MAAIKRVFSGIQPTGVPQLGNYLGSIKNWVALQKDSDGNKATSRELFYSVVDLHALTVPRDPKRLHRETIEAAAALIACGIDPNHSVLFRQSAVPAHSQLYWALGCIAPVGWLNRMTQWKSKLQQQQQQQTDKGEILSDNAITKLNVHSGAAQGLLTGLFTYPVLMAADVLLYNATHVPVGEDQVQHLEFARDLAMHFNKQYKQEIFTMPKIMLTPSKRIMSLKDPLRKMSKSDHNEQARITLSDTDDQISHKIRKAPTDSIRGITYDPSLRPGVSNLLSIYSAIRDTDPESAALSMHSFSNAQLKEAVAEAIVSEIAPIRQEMRRLLADQGHIDQILCNNETKARDVAHAHWKIIAKCVGLKA
ncbi:Tryptophan--tRNA ligase, mitochondrial [Coemansia sp. RSA 1813]|nr:Tryptophan--tRNA ligase, mitochondrial [Coemansia sp. RSA 1843]KAJ2089501.1 Tryptophan--tRNA ligase, mitochondrial [Coemansia sp. RSA 986]KAJ2214528.1 Tryptophan--tRNA ligase, mitochondrial [Coemansia sp. RSA 487]KAJ2569411.1 Tryptophan--tRNA ligase, mitochondrial [Coemansia sp. RSA 1813]